MNNEPQGEVKGRIAPNTTQTPNLYLDHYMAFLTGDEWKVLTYTVRRIMGFQKQSDRISISQYAHGTKDKDGTPLDFGTGISEQSVGKVLKKLIEFGFIVAVDDDKGNQGKCYSLQLDETKIDSQAILARQATEKARNQKRTESMRQKAAEKRERGQSHRPPDEPKERSVAQTTSGQSHRPLVVSRTDTQKKVEIKGKDSSAPVIPEPEWDNLPPNPALQKAKEQKAVQALKLELDSLASKTDALPKRSKRPRDRLFDLVMLRSFCANPKNKANQKLYAGQTSSVCGALRQALSPKPDDIKAFVSELRSAYRWHARQRDKDGKPLHPCQGARQVVDMLKRYRRAIGSVPKQPAAHSAGRYEEKEIEPGIWRKVWVSHERTA